MKSWACNSNRCVGLRCWQLRFGLLFSLCWLSSGSNAADATQLQELNVGRARKALVFQPLEQTPKRNQAIAISQPVLLFFHGGGGDMQQAAKAYGLQKTAVKYGFLLVFANGTSRLPRDKLATWNAGACCGYARDQQIDDVQYVRDLLKALRARWPIDNQRIYATGMSNGAMLVHRLACEMADELAAVATVAGTDNTRSCQPARPIALLHIHALDDTHVLYQGGAGADAFRDRSKVTEFTSVPATIARWLARNGLSSEHRTQQNAEMRREFYQTAAKGGDAAAFEVQLISTAAGGHSWPGSPAVRGKTPAKFDANEVIWQFFQDKSLR